MKNSILLVILFALFCFGYSACPHKDPTKPDNTYDAGWEPDPSPDFVDSKKPAK